MSPLLVVVGEVAGEVPDEAAELGHQAPSERRPPALFEDCALDALDRAVGRRPAGPDERLNRTELADGLAKGVLEWEEVPAPKTMKEVLDTYDRSHDAATRKLEGAEAARWSGNVP